MKLNPITLALFTALAVPAVAVPTASAESDEQNIERITVPRRVPQSRH